MTDPIDEQVDEPADEPEHESEHAAVMERLDVIDHPDADDPASPSATVVLARDGEDELEVLMIHRGAETAFGGMWAFPGGVIEEDDIPAGTEPDPLPAARRAAVRETQEELGLHIDEASLVWWSHWLPPADSPRRFSTWFFLAPGGDRHADEHVAVDGDEVIVHEWIAPANALARQAAGEILIAPPTFITLEQLHRYGDVASALAAADPQHFATEIAFGSDGVRICLWEGDASYGLGDPMVQGPRRRLVMDEAAGWRYLNTVG
ncbi:MAG: NUDIX hydrolase [Ilumatobacter sp.]|uniref:NUDIX hydrolase n=1 Tax=Ilumatobacter sp. TaxID=1967498 RepID=UPI002604CE43|nr:NUDIX hydrolase [Ilumatobacter sp.]MDJ0770244.1 NUDIX hydrolase [Ilumatobacter sp.]